jgi:hypothetical protein
MTKEDNGALPRGTVTDLDCHNSDLKKICNFHKKLFNFNPNFAHDSKTNNGH